MTNFYKITIAAAIAATASTVLADNMIVRDTSSPATKSEVFKTFSSARTVLAEKKVADGVKKRVVRDAKGRVFCDIVRNGKVSTDPQIIKKPLRAPGNASFFEDFESHQDELDWLPEGWSEINTPENIPTPEMCQHYINNSWAAQDTGDGYWTDITSDGVKECWIHFTYNWSYKNSEGEEVAGSAAPQDEWLISPAFTVQQNHDLFFLAEMDCGSIFAYDWYEEEYDRNTIECDLEVLVSEDNGENWTSLWKASKDVCSGLTDAQMYDMMAELKYNSYSASLADYYGKTIKLAFRYTNSSNGGFAGNSMAVDAITVAAPQAEAFYNLPTGSFLAGLSKDLHVYTESYGLMPAYADIEWNAASNAYTSSNSWTFFDSDGETLDTFDGNTHIVNYPYSKGKPVAWPQLTASNANSSDTYSFDGKDSEKGGIYFGGSIPNIAADEPVYVGNYDYQHKHLVTPYLAPGDYVYGTASEGAWGNNITQTKFGNLFYAPAAPFLVNEVILTLGEYDADDDAEFTLEIFEIDQYGQVSDTPATTSTLLGSEISGFGFYNAVFHLDKPYIMTGHTLMMISGYADNPKVREFAACAQSQSNDPANNYAYMIYDIQGKSVLYSAADALEDYSSALILSLEGGFHFLQPEDAIIELDPELNESQMLIYASNYPGEWWIVDGDNRIEIDFEGNTRYDWITISQGEQPDCENTYGIKFSAEPSETDRAKTVVLCNGGNEVRIRVKQAGASGIGNITADNKITMIVRNGLLTITGIADNVRVDIYSTDGCRVLSGTNGLDLTGLAGGVYMVRAANRTFKLIR